MLFLAAAWRLELLYSTGNAVLNSFKAFRILLNYLMKSKTAISYRSLSGEPEIVKNTIVKDTIAGENLAFKKDRNLTCLKLCIQIVFYQSVNPA